MNNQKFAKFSLLVIVGSLVLFCAGASLTPLVEGLTHSMFLASMTGFFVGGVLVLVLEVRWHGKVVVKTPQLPGKVLLWGALLAGVSFGTMLQTPPMSQMSQALYLFTIACLACTVALPPLLWLTTEPEKKTPVNKKPGLVLLK